MKGRWVWRTRNRWTSRDDLGGVSGRKTVGRMDALEEADEGRLEL